MEQEGAPSVGARIARPFPGWSFPSGRVLARVLSLPSDSWQVRMRAIRDGLLIAGLLATAFILVVIPATGHSLGYDAYAYWSIDQ